MKLRLLRNAVAALKNVPVDLGQYELRHTTHGKEILFSRVGEGQGRKALDLGCRDRFWSKKLEACVYDVVSADVKPLDSSVVPLDANETFPFRSEIFDLVWCSEVIEHLENPS